MKKEGAHVDCNLEIGCIQEPMSCLVEGMSAFMKGPRRRSISEL